MRVEIDTHTHTLASGHAYNTLNEMAQAAADKGLKGLAITEHAPEMPGTCHLFYFQNLRIVPRKKYGIELLLGTELNIMNARGETDLPDSVLERLDIAIASIHMPCFKDERTIDNVTAAYEKVMEHPYVDIIGHPDDGIPWRVVASVEVETVDSVGGCFAVVSFLIPDAVTERFQSFLELFNIIAASAYGKVAVGGNTTFERNDGTFVDSGDN